MKTLEEEIKDAHDAARFRKRMEFYSTQQTCKHNRTVNYWRPGDWYHADDGTLCNQGPDYEGKELGP